MHITETRLSLFLYFDLYIVFFHLILILHMTYEVLLKMDFQVKLTYSHSEQRP